MAVKNRSIFKTLKLVKWMQLLINNVDSDTLAKDVGGGLRLD